MAGDPLVAREQLRRLFDGGQLLLQPQKEGSYVAEGRIDLRVLLQMRFSPASSQTRGTPNANGPPFAGRAIFHVVQRWLRERGSRTGGSQICSEHHLTDRWSPSRAPLGGSKRNGWIVRVTPTGWIYSSRNTPKHPLGA
jgi:hypothetical protein